MFWSACIAAQAGMQIWFLQTTVADFLIIGLCEPRHEKTLTFLHANNKGADQPAHLCSLVSVFVIH